ncbi:uncharacterized protein [Typha latifolia]|uniref:uncharacterized protein n=1 Tax=Typha latifolia TaxID=4733 RepID=UPI003C2FB0E5
MYKGKFKEKYKEIDDAIRNDDWTYLQKLLSEKFIPNDDEMNLSDAVNLSDDPLLSVVVAYDKSDLALRLLDVMPEGNLWAKNIYGDTALHVAAAKGDVRVVEALVTKWEALIWLKNTRRLLEAGRKYPEHYSTLFYLLELIYRFPVTWIRQLVFNVLKQSFPSIQKLQEQKRKQRQTRQLIALLARESDYWNFYNRGGKPFNKKKFYPSNGIESIEEILLKKLVKCCCQKKDATENHARWSESPLIIGAKMGFDEFVEKILDLFPESTSNLDTEGMNVLQVAIKYGHKKITKLILSKISGSNPTIPSGLLSYVHPSTGNTILHFAAEKTVKDRSFPLQMQYELQWFEEIRNMVPKDLLHHRNKNEQTAEELFTENHKDMVTSSEVQLVEMGKTCSALVVAVVFASTFSIPGDKDANQNPIFFHRTAFKVFSHAYVIGLSSAATSFMLFLSFLNSSNYREQDFRRFLPIKYLLANVSFPIALVALFIAFSCNIYLQIYGGKPTETKYIIPFICDLVVFPSVCLLVLFYHLPSIEIGYFLRHVWR